MSTIKHYLLLSFFILTLGSCMQPTPGGDGKPGLYDSEAFKQYWYAGKAEVNAYNLDQSRYGENRQGKAMLIFVTEGFSKKKHVKLDDPQAAGNDNVAVMKMNYTKNFVTGIYPYSMMISTFTPISRNQMPHTFKVTMTSQEWCGHVFSQINMIKSRYNVSSYSYFEQEGDTHFTTEKVLLEDELMNLIRIDPENIPLGKTQLLPGLFFTRLKHDNLMPQEVTLTKETLPGEIHFVIDFPERKLTIKAEAAFPHKILGWEEQFTERGQSYHTTAVLDKTLYTDYWRKNKNEFLPLRDSLGLSPTNF